MHASIHGLHVLLSKHMAVALRVHCIVLNNCAVDEARMGLKDRHCMYNNTWYVFVFIPPFFGCSNALQVSGQDLLGRLLQLMATAKLLLPLHLHLEVLGQAIFGARATALKDERLGRLDCRRRLLLVDGSVIALPVPP